MTKAELALILHDKTGISRKDAIAHVEALLDLIKSTLESGEQVKIAGFGVFGIFADKGPKYCRTDKSHDTTHHVDCRRTCKVNVAHV